MNPPLVVIPGPSGPGFFGDRDGMNRETVVKAEFMGSQRDLLVEYEIDDGRPVNHTVQMIRQRAGGRELPGQ